MYACDDGYQSALDLLFGLHWIYRVEVLDLAVMLLWYVEVVYNSSWY